MGLRLFQRWRGLGSKGEVCEGKNYRIICVMANPTVIWRLGCPFLPRPEIREQWHHVLKPEQIKRCRRESYGPPDIRIRKRMLRKGRMNGEKCFWSDILGGSSLCGCQLLFFLVNWILRSPVFSQDQMSGGAFFIVKYEAKVWHLVIWQQCQCSGVLGKVISVNHFCKIIRIKQ